MTVKQNQLDEKVQTGGGATGIAHTADPVAMSPKLPASNLGNGEPMNRIARITPGEGEEETSTENNTKPTKDSAGSNKASVAMKGSASTPSQSYSFNPNTVKEDINAMFIGTDLTEEFKEKATLIFETAITAQVNEIVKDLEEQYNNALADELVKLHEDLSEKINQYMSYTVEQWMEQNEVAIEHSLRTEITENFITNLKNLFETSYINIPEEKFDVVEGMQTEFEEMKSLLDQVIEDNIALSDAVNESIRKEILSQVSEGLAATQTEKLQSLSEGVEFDNASNYRKKLEIVKENYFPAEKLNSSTQNMLEQLNETNEEPAKVTNTPVSRYADAISRTVKK